MAIDVGERKGIVRSLYHFIGDSIPWLDGRPLLPLLAELWHYPRYAGMLRPNTPSGARAYHKVMRRLFARENAERARLGDRLTAGGSDRIEPDKGYLLRSLGDHPAVRDCLARCDEIRADPNFERALQNHGAPMLRTYQLRQDVPENEPIFRLATDPILLAPIADYLGGIPVLQAAAISYSPNREFAGQSQCFHLDKDDYRQIKCNIYLEDIDEESGPMTLVPSDGSRRIFDRLHRQGVAPNRSIYLDDKHVVPPGSAEDVIPLCGPRGSVALVDTCNCFHYGSRPSQKARLTLYLQYVSAFAVSLPLWGRRIEDHGLARVDSREADRIRTLVLGLSHHGLQRVKRQHRVIPVAGT